MNRLMTHFGRAVLLADLTNLDPGGFRPVPRVFPITPWCGSCPTKFVEALVVDSEVMCNLMDDRRPYLLDQFVPRGAHLTERQAIDRDFVRHLEEPVRLLFGQGNALVEAKQVRLVKISIFDHDHDIVHE